MTSEKDNDEIQATEEIQEMIETFKKEVQNRCGKEYPKFEAINFRKKIVAGTNIYIKVKTDEDQYIHLKVFKPYKHLSNIPKLHGVRYRKSADDKLNCF